MVALTWRTELWNADSFENEIRALVPGRHCIASDGSLDAGAGGLEDVNKDKLSSCRDDHALRNIISQQSGQGKCSSAKVRQRAVPDSLPRRFPLETVSLKQVAGGSKDANHGDDWLVLGR